MESSQIYQEVSKHYSSIANAAENAEYSRKVAVAFGYSEEELAAIPRDANLGVSCGNPVALANLKEGETIIDLGSGAGFDVFLAAKRVGPTGKAIGVDMNRDMLTRANRNLDRSTLTNISFVESQITSIALKGQIANCIISNCVINLVPQEQKHRVFEEMFRLLKPGGRVAISDILAKMSLPDDLTKNLAAYVGCISGASEVAEYEKWLHDAGFVGIKIVDTGADLNVYRTADKPEIACCAGQTSPAKDEKVASPCSTADVYADMDLNQWAGSYKIFALKP
ncbi:ubiE/COQ5 methyltransferase [Lojkania enalia]|uniref:Arsenite methyltransferase n=1 Tax=Lojkania enalia TaxID=147567 RepID=A0A9P4KI33_9PLEO|nr:ubiE/COQ5 methyltransferase [Didymosphaeria enalia]